MHFNQQLNSKRSNISTKSLHHKASGLLKKKLKKQQSKGANLAQQEDKKEDRSQGQTIRKAIARQEADFRDSEAIRIAEELYAKINGTPNENPEPADEPADEPGEITDGPIIDDATAATLPNDIKKKYTFVFKKLDVYLDSSSKPTTCTSQQDLREKANILYERFLNRGDSKVLKKIRRYLLQIEQTFERRG